MERWRAIFGFPLYEVSDEGRVRSLDREVWNGRGAFTHRGRILVPFVTPKGYHAVNLRRDAHMHPHKLVHRLVYSAFVGNPEGMQIRHLDGNPANNTLENITVGTNSENQHDSVRHGTHHCARKTHCKHGHEFTPENTTHYIQAHGGQGRRCKRCAASRQRAYTARKRQ